ncbi:uncharacterized protein LOC123440751 [Hordeum vulgare subsp. vulgare]|uniref:uncharacterized protein LOC123440751 n=1 Tax=Hordeum vulgare subsp. vulgare TaxID=112509 RepID=UPI001D1A3B2C|nr:uncharacterized protein LOC123440751 [Hordeum vulgare subsp. vulgare]
MRGRRRMVPKSAVAFVVDKPLSYEESQNLCQHILQKHNDEVAFTVGGTQMTGAELLKCKDDAESSLNIVDPFIEYLKCDDKKNGIKRIILQRQHQVLEEELVQVITKEIGSSEKKGANIEQRFLFCPMTREQECIVLCVDTSINNQVIAFLSNDTGISGGQVETIGKSFQEKVEKACQTCGYVSPFPNSSSVRISSVSLEARHSDSSFASMLCIEEYDGKKMPTNFKNPDKAEEEKVWFLGNLLMHEKNTALPEEIREMVRNGVFKKQKRR